MATTTSTTAAPAQVSASRPAEESSSYVPRGPVEAELIFYSPPEDGSAPFNYVETPPEGMPQRNFTEEPHKVTVSDIRSHEKDHTLDSSAFQALSHIHSVADYSTFDDEEAIRRVYYPEVENLLLSQVPGARRVFLFDHTIRRSDPNASRAPVTRVHIDQTPNSAEQRVRYHMENEADELLKDRCRIINVWRPLSKTGSPVQANPLAFADSRSVLDTDLVGVQHRYPHRTGETAGVKYNEEQKWHYWSGMTNNERLLLKCSDTKPGVPGKRVPHTAFIDPRTPPGAEGRESIEVRALVFG